jgi:DNA-binding CsgD family transcriptional regulator
MADSWARSRARARIERVCASPLDSRALRQEILAELRSCVGYDAYAWPLTDPVSAVGGAPLAEVPCLPELPRLIRLKYRSGINRWTELAGSGQPVRSLAQRTGGDLARSLLWRGILEQHDIGDTASTVFADSNGCWGFLDLWRERPGWHPFSEEDVRLLTDVAPTVTTALRTRQARAFTARPPAPPAGEGPAVMVLDEELRITAATSAATAWLRRLHPGPPGEPPVPAVVYNVAAQLLAAEAGVDAHAPSSRVRADGGHGWVTVRAGRVDAPGAGSAAIAVTIEPTPPSERLELFARSHGLTAREGQLLGLVAGGGDTRTIARSMGVTQHTVQDHLKSIFAKTSARSRHQLLTTALGTSRPA